MSNHLFKAPFKGLVHQFMSRWVNNKSWHDLRYGILSKLPYMQMKSEAVDIVYMNWIVPIDKVQTTIPALLPKDMPLLSKNGHTILTLLTYQHKHFGPKFIGFFRKVFPSPKQSNWRLYLKMNKHTPYNDNLEVDDDTIETVLFIKNMMDSALYTYTTRLFTDVLPSHLPKDFVHHVNGENISSMITEGEGSAAGYRLNAKVGSSKQLPAEYLDYFSSWEAAMRALCLQSSAVCVGYSDDFIAEASIKLPINIAEIEPIDVVDFEPGLLLTQLGALNPPFCFLVKKVDFEVLSEKRVANA